jgi:hypothetical protein
MTTPPTGGTLGGSFESGDDFIAARVTIDIPTEGISGLREITQEMDHFRTSVEAANRSSETFSSYLMQIAEAASQAATAQENLVQMLERTTDYQNRAVTSGAGGPSPQLNAPAQYTNPFAGTEIGMGGTPGGMNTEDVNTQLEALRTQNPRAYINKMAASGQYQMGDIPASSPTGMDIQNAADRIGQRAQLTQEGMNGLGAMGDIGSRSGRMGAIAQQVLNEISPDSSPLGVSGMIQRGLGAMSSVPGRFGELGTGLRRAMGAAGVPDRMTELGEKLSQSGAGSSIPAALGELGGTLGTGLARAGAIAGPLAGAVGIGLAGYGLVQGAGGIYQDYKNMGAVRGGGAAEGVGYEMSIRAMAMNPFISGDQSRQIVQQGLRDGYTGKEFDTVTNMVATNLKDFNMQISDSFALVRKNVIEGGQSMLGMASAMGALKDMSKDGYRSLPELQQSYAATSGALVTAGMSGTQASEAALLSGQMFKDNAVLAGTGDQIAQAFGTNPQDLAIMKYQGGLNVPAGLMPQAMPYMMKGDALVGGGTETIKKFALQYWNGRGKPKRGTVPYYNAVAMWGMRLQQMGLPFANEPQKVEEMFNEFTSGKNPVGEANKEVKEAQADQVELKTRNPLQSMGGGLVDFGATALGEASDIIGQVGGSVADFFTGNSGNIDDRWRGLGSRTLDRMADNGSVSPYRISALENIQRTYGSRGFEIIDANQQVQKMNYNSKEQMEKLSSGELRWRPKGSDGAGYTLSQTPGVGGEDLKKFAGGKTEVTGAVTITLTPEAQKLLQVQGGGNKVQLTTHEQQANAGYGQATLNNAPPGEGRR